LNSTTQNTIGYALALILDTTPGDSDDVSKLIIKEVFTVCREKFCSINGAPIGRLVHENLHKERAMLAPAETKPKNHLQITMVGRINPMVQIHRLLRLRRN
jgi:hypothetical protein